MILTNTGDHKQLRPKVEQYRLRVESGWSRGLPHTTLELQHRMPPEVRRAITLCMDVVNKTYHEFPNVSVINAGVRGEIREITGAKVLESGGSSNVSYAPKIVFCCVRRSQLFYERIFFRARQTFPTK